MDPVHSNGHKPRRNRQNPVSCRLCRLRKLKCNRQQPCSNCSARGVGCEYFTQNSAPKSTDSAGEKAAAPNTAGLQARLERLEEAVFHKQDDGSSAPIAFSPFIRDPLATTAVPDFVFDEGHEVASSWLEGISTLQNPTWRSSTVSIPCRILPISQLLGTATRTEAAPRPLSVDLPTKDEAINLLQYFLEHVEYLHPVFCSDSLQRMIDTIYLPTDAAIQARVSDIALLLSILASASHLWKPQRSKCLIFLSTTEAAAMSLTWTNAALDVLEYSKRTSATLIAQLQATIVISYLVYNSQGFSPLFRSLHSSSIMIARDLSLHKTDSLRQDTQTAAPPAEADIGIKRRIWWHITATDWLLAFTPGPQEGTYSIQPSQMRVHQPYLTETSDGGVDNTSLLYNPYFVQRLRLAELCRAVVDSRSLLTTTEDMNYEQVILLDAQFENLIRRLPAIFQLGKESELTGATPQLALQRYLIHLGIYARRSRLHQPFIIAGLTDSRYAFSRNAGLSSSRAVLDICYKLEENRDDLELVPARLATVVHHVFMATVVLAMDLCSNKVDGLEEQRQADVTRACRALDSLKQDSKIASRLAQPLMEILQRHKDKLQKQQPPATSATTAVPTDKSMAHAVPTPGSLHRPLATSTGRNISVVAASTDNEQLPTATEVDGPSIEGWEFDAMMQEYIDMGPNIDGPSWGSIFDDIDAHHMTDAWDTAFTG